MKTMNKFITTLVAALLCTGCAKEKTLTVTVSNPISLERSGEMVEVPMEEVTERLKLSDTDQVVVTDESGTEVPSQITHNGRLLFPATVKPDGQATYVIARGVPAEVPVTACGREYPERDDDVAWENDLVAFRAYGPALQARGERGFGYDLFCKRGTTEPVLEDMYAKQLDPEMWKQVNELRKTDPQAARELENTFTYHVDHGQGMDCYAVGPTLGAGTSALMVNGQLIYPWCYDKAEILDNGPLRFSVKLTFKPIQIGTDSAVVETRLITLDTGSHLNKTVLTYNGLSQPTQLATGIVLHDATGATDASSANYIAYEDPTTGADNGKIYIGAVFPMPVLKQTEVRFTPDEKKQHANAEGHLLAINNYEPGMNFTYYWGFGWNRSDVTDFNAWTASLKQTAQKAAHPLTVQTN